MKKEHVKLSEIDRHYLGELIGKGQQTANVWGVTDVSQPGQPLSQT